MNPESQRQSYNDKLGHVIELASYTNRVEKYGTSAQLRDAAHELSRAIKDLDKLSRNNDSLRSNFESLQRVLHIKSNRGIENWTKVKDIIELEKYRDGFYEKLAIGDIVNELTAVPTPEQKDFIFEAVKDIDLNYWKEVSRYNFDNLSRDSNLNIQVTEVLEKISNIIGIDMPLTLAELTFDQVNSQSLYDVFSTIEVLIQLRGQLHDPQISDPEKDLILIHARDLLLQSKLSINTQRIFAEINASFSPSDARQIRGRLSSKLFESSYAPGRVGKFFRRSPKTGGIQYIINERINKQRATFFALREIKSIVKGFDAPSRYKKVISPKGITRRIMRTFQQVDSLTSNLTGKIGSPNIEIRDWQKYVDENVEEGFGGLITLPAGYYNPIQLIKDSITQESEILDSTVTYEQTIEDTETFLSGGLSIKKFRRRQFLGLSKEGNSHLDTALQMMDPKFWSKDLTSYNGRTGDLQDHRLILAFNVDPNYLDASSLAREEIELLTKDHFKQIQDDTYVDILVKAIPSLSKKQFMRIYKEKGLPGLKENLSVLIDPASPEYTAAMTAIERELVRFETNYINTRNSLSSRVTNILDENALKINLARVDHVTGQGIANPNVQIIPDFHFVGTDSQSTAAANKLINDIQSGKYTNDLDNPLFGPTDPNSILDYLNRINETCKNLSRRYDIFKSLKDAMPTGYMKHISYEYSIYSDSFTTDLFDRIDINTIELLVIGDYTLQAELDKDLSSFETDPFANISKFYKVAEPVVYLDNLATRIINPSPTGYLIKYSNALDLLAQMSTKLDTAISSITPTTITNQIEPLLTKIANNIKSKLTNSIDEARRQYKVKRLSIAPDQAEKMKNAIDSLESIARSLKLI